MGVRHAQWIFGYISNPHVHPPVSYRNPIQLDTPSKHTPQFHFRLPVVREDRGTGDRGSTVPVMFLICGRYLR